MGFRLVANSVTLDDLERRNNPNHGLMSPNSVAFGTGYVKVVENTPILSATQGSAAMSLRCDWICNDHFVANFVLSLATYE